MTAIAERFAITAAEQAAILVRAQAVLDRARDRAWSTGGIRVISEMGLLDATLRDARRGGSVLSVLCAETAAENLIITIRRVCGDDEARYVGGAE